MRTPSTRSQGDPHPSTTTTTASASPSPTPDQDQDPLGLNPGFVTLYPGLLPAIPNDASLPEKAPSSNAATGASAAGVRALTSQAVAFYFRAPAKAFFRTRVDYLAYARALQEQELAARRAGAKVTATSSLSSPLASSSSSPPPHPQPPSHHPPHPPPPSRLAPATHWLRTRLASTTPALLASAIRHSGWRVVPDQVLPPLIANVAVGAVLYTTYLQTLARLHPDSGRASSRVYPPPSPGDTFAAGFVAGAVQSVVAAPLDAVQARWDARVGGVRAGEGNGGVGGNGNGRPRSMWAFSAAKLQEIGLRGVFAGWGVSFLKDSMGSAVFFSVFEYVKAQSYYTFVRWYYGSLNEDAVVLLSRKRPAAPGDGPVKSGTGIPADAEEQSRMPTIIRPHYAIEPAFLLLAGMSASIAQQVVLHPLSHVQAEHWERLEGLDAKARKLRREARLAEPPSSSMWRYYRDAYRTTWGECVAEAQAAGLSMRQWLYRGFWWNTIRQVPSTSAGLIIFELFRRKYGGGDQVRINRDGYDILLS